MANSKYYTTNHRKKEAEVIADDFYSTHPKSVNTFIDTACANFDIKYNFETWPIWECAAGSGNISKQLLKYKHFKLGTPWKVISTDLVDRGFCKFGVDFLDQKNLPDDTINTIITNPPYKYAEEFIRHAHTFPVNMIIMYLKLTFLEGIKRYKLFKDFKPSYIYLHSSRQACDPQGREDFVNSGATAYAWFVWLPKSNIKNTSLLWLPPN
jgi:hypothetical protein